MKTWRRLPKSFSARRHTFKWNPWNNRNRYRIGEYHGIGHKLLARYYHLLNKPKPFGMIFISPSRTTDHSQLNEAMIWFEQGGRRYNLIRGKDGRLERLYF